MNTRYTFALGFCAAVIIGWVIIFAVRKDNEPSYHGMRISEWLQKNQPDSSRVSLNELLALRKVLTGKEPDIAAFEVPISYDALTNTGYLDLLIDGRAAQFQECDRATNGNCLLEWNTTFDSPGQHQLQAELAITKGLGVSHVINVTGPISSFYSSNVCQFDPVYTEYDAKNGGWFHATLIETNAKYKIELREKNGLLIKTIVGSTSNGVIDTHWDLTDNDGNTYTNGGELEATFYITFPDSGTHIQKIP